MILTLTPNPTIDRVIFVRGFQLGAVVRAEHERVTPSGKGVDASLVVRELGGDTVALGLKAGFNGRLHEGLLAEWGVPHHFVPAYGETRLAVVLVDLAVHQQSTISAPTLTATNEHLAQLIDTLDRYAGRAWGLICGGSLPPGLPSVSYARLLHHAKKHGLITLLDSSGDALCQGIKGLPHVLKVNEDELEALDAGMARECRRLRGAGRDDDGMEDRTVEDCSALVEGLSLRLGDWAGDALVVTLGKQGALAVTAEGSYRARPPKVPVVNTAGAGDALSGGIMLARSQGADWPTALAVGTAAAASVVGNEGTAVCRREQVETYLSQVQVDRLDGT